MALKKYENEKVFTLRINIEVFEKIKLLAQKHKRSISKEIEFILENISEK